MPVLYDCAVTDARGPDLVLDQAVLVAGDTIAWMGPAETAPREAADLAVIDTSGATRVAHAAGVRIAGGSDFGGGSVRAGHLPWEVSCLVACGLEPWEALAAVT